MLLPDGDQAFMQPFSHQLLLKDGNFSISADQDFSIFSSIENLCDRRLGNDA